MQARAQAKAPRNFVINRLSFLCLRSVNASSLSIDFIRVDKSNWSLAGAKLLTPRIGQFHLVEVYKIGIV